MYLPLKFMEAASNQTKYKVIEIKEENASVCERNERKRLGKENRMKKNKIKKFNFSYFSILN